MEQGEKGMGTQEARIEQRWTKEGNESWCIIAGERIIGFGDGDESKKSCHQLLDRGDDLSIYTHCESFTLNSPPTPEANSGSIPIDYAAWIRDWLSKHKLPANDYYTPDMLREFHAAIVTNSGSIKRGEDGSITQKMRGRPVTQKEAMESAQRLINSHFNNPDRARMQIPVSAADDDVIVTDYIREQPAVSEGIATQECAICGRPAHGDFPRKPVVSEGKPEPASINQEMQEAAKLLVEAMETCHICKGLLVLQKNPAHCEDCSRDCEGHEGSECTPIYELHRILKAVLAKADSMGGK